MKKSILMVLVIMLTFEFFCIDINAKDIEKVVKSINLTDNSPEKINGILYVHLRPVFEALGWNVLFNPSNNSIICTKNNDTMEFTVGSSEFFINGSYNIMNAPLVLVDNKSYIPQKLIVDQFGIKIKWNGEDNLIIMSDKELNSVTVNGEGNVIITGDSIIVNIYEPCNIKTLNDMMVYTDQLLKINPYEALINYKEILDNVNREEMSDFYARVMNNMGNAYSILAKFNNTKTNILNAIGSYQSAIEFYSESNDISNYNILLINLGNAYSVLAEVTQDSQYITQSIDNYKKALEYYTFENFPMDYALAQYDLGRAYKHQGSNKLAYDCFSNAENVYVKALDFCLLDNNPETYAFLQYNLGNIYNGYQEISDESFSTKTEKCYKEALKIWTAESSPLNYANIYKSLGDSYSKLYVSGKDSIYLEKAIKSYRESLDFYNPEIYPVNYSEVHYSLGNLYSLASQVSGNESYLTNSVTAFENGIKVLNESNNPVLYKNLAKKLGMTNVHIPDSTDKEAIQDTSKAYKLLTQVSHFRK